MRPAVGSWRPINTGDSASAAGVKLILELAVVSKRYAGDFFNNELADRHVWKERDIQRAEVD